MLYRSCLLNGGSFNPFYVFERPVLLIRSALSLPFIGSPTFKAQNLPSSPYHLIGWPPCLYPVVAGLPSYVTAGYYPESCPLSCASNWGFGTYFHGNFFFVGPWKNSDESREFGHDTDDCEPLDESQGEFCRGTNACELLSLLGRIPRIWP